MFLAKLSSWATVLGLFRPVSSLEFSRNEVGSNRFKDLVLKHRVYSPYGPDLTTSPPQSAEEVWAGYGFGLGAAEHIAYDHKEGYMYVQVEEFPHIAIFDWHDSTAPTLTGFSMELSQFDSDIKDIIVCSETGLLFVALTDADKVAMYSTVKRSDPQKPELVIEISAGSSPDNLAVNPECTILAVANENDGEAFAEGAVHLIENFSGTSPSPVVRKVSLSGFSDDYLLSRNVHMPLSLNAMTYWDDYSNIRDDINWTEVRNNYNPAFFFMPENLIFSDDSATLFVNLQDNSALVRVDVSSATAKVIDGYGLKEWSPNSGREIDIVDDGGCTKYASNPALYTTLATDGFDVVTIDGTTYLITADEGTDAEFGAYEEKIDSADLFAGTAITARRMVADSTLLDTNSSSSGFSAHFNSDCEDNGLDWCSNFAMSLGSSGIDYSVPEKPVIKKIVGFGSRGISIFKVPSSYDEAISLVWDSGDDFEKEGCATFPWAHNAVQDEAFAPVNGARYELLPEEREDLDDANDPTQDGCDDAGNGQPGACPMSETVDEKAQEDGLAPESVIAAIACGRVLVVSCGENNAMCFIYDITDIDNGSDPQLVKVFNLSPASETKSPGVAYADSTLGDLDSESPIFVNACQSPTGKPGIFMNGAHSGTVSFWEFECVNGVETCTDEGQAISGESETATSSGSSDSGGLSGGAIAGIVVGAVVVIGILGFVVMKRGRGSDVEMDTGKSGAVEEAQTA